MTLAHTFDFLSPPRTSNLLPNTGSLPEPSAGPWKVPRLCAPYSGLILTRAILGLWVLAARAPSPWEARPMFGHIRGAGGGGPGEALGSWVARQTSKPQRILSPQEEVRPQLVLWERVSAAAWRASDLLGLGHRRGRSETQPLASGVWAGGGEVSTGGSKAWPRGGGLGAAAGPVADSEQLWSRPGVLPPQPDTRGAMVAHGILQRSAKTRPLSCLVWAPAST